MGKGTEPVPEALGLGGGYPVLDRLAPLQPHRRAVTHLTRSALARGRGGRTIVVERQRLLAPAVRRLTACSPRRKILPARVVSPIRPV